MLKVRLILIGQETSAYQWHSYALGILSLWWYWWPTYTASGAGTLPGSVVDMAQSSDLEQPRMPT